MAGQIAKVRGQRLRKKMRSMCDGRIPYIRRRVEPRVLAPPVSIDVSRFHQNGLHSVLDRNFDNSKERRISRWPDVASEEPLPTPRGRHVIFDRELRWIFSPLVKRHGEAAYAKT